MKYFIIVLLAVLLICSGCGMVSGLCDDVKWAADTTERAILDAE